MNAVAATCRPLFEAPIPSMPALRTVECAAPWSVGGTVWCVDARRAARRARLRGDGGVRGGGLNGGMGWLSGSRSNERVCLSRIAAGGETDPTPHHLARAPRVSNMRRMPESDPSRSSCPTTAGPRNRSSTPARKLTADSSTAGSTSAPARSTTRSRTSSARCARRRRRWPTRAPPRLETDGQRRTPEQLRPARRSLARVLRRGPPPPARGNGHPPPARRAHAPLHPRRRRRPRHDARDAPPRPVPQHAPPARRHAAPAQQRRRVDVAGRCTGMNVEQGFPVRVRAFRISSASRGTRSAAGAARRDVVRPAFDEAIMYLVLGSVLPLSFAVPCIVFGLHAAVRRPPAWVARRNVCPTLIRP